MNLILNNISKIIPLTDEEQSIFLSKIEEKQYQAKSILLQEGEICTHSYFVKSGILRSFSRNENLVEHVLHFACQGWWISDMHSLLSQKPSQLVIEVIEDAEIVLLSKKNQEELYAELPKLERFFRILTEKSLVTERERLMDNLSLTAEERFEKFCKKYPSLIQKVPQKYIASYIGVTPEFFSKMKSKLLSKKFK
jgi:CRP/FNR family transcriptional regulator, anaerobic regulatory protein